MVGTAWHKRMNAHKACKEDNPLHVQLSRTRPAALAGGPGVSLRRPRSIAVVDFGVVTTVAAPVANHTVTVVYPKFNTHCD